MLLNIQKVYFRTVNKLKRENGARTGDVSDDPGFTGASQVSFYFFILHINDIIIL